MPHRGADARRPLPRFSPRRAGRALGGSFGRAKNLLYIFLSDGPSQYETFNPKPDAPAEIRGDFRPIATLFPGAWPATSR